MADIAKLSVGREAYYTRELGRSWAGTVLTRSGALLIATALVILAVGLI
jgi:hypothetical protein